MYGELTEIVAKHIDSKTAEEIMESLCSRVMVYPEDMGTTDLPTLLLGFCSNDDILESFEPLVFADLMDGLIAYSTPKYQDGLAAPWEILGEGEEDQAKEKKVWDAYNSQKEQATLLMQTIRNLVDEIVKSRIMEEQLKNSEQKFHRMLEISPETKLIHIKGKIVYANPAGVDIFGAKGADELIGSSVMDLIQSDYHESHPDLKSHKDEGGQGEQIRDRIIRLDGRYMDVEVSASPTTYEGKSAVQLSIKDITERIRAQRALKESENRYRLLAENIADVIWTMDMNLNFTYVSPSVMRLRGYSVEEAMDQDIADVLTPESLEKAHKFFEDELKLDMITTEKDEVVRSLELEQYCKDGSIVKTEVLMTGLRDDVGEPYGILGVTRDASERKKAEAKLQASEIRFRRLFNQMVDGVYRTTRKGKILSANPALVKMLGFRSFKELKNVNVGKDLYVESKERNKYIKQLEKTGNLRNLELHLRRKDGKEIVVLENAHVIKDEKGKVRYYEGTLTDITNRITAEIELKESEERFRRLFDHMVEGVFRTTPAGEILSANPAMVQMLGYRSEKELKKIDIAKDLYANSNDRKTFIRKLGQEGTKGPWRT
jgi:PAS domain S-box-containing protein